MKKKLLFLIILITFSSQAQTIIKDGTFANNGIYLFENQTTGHSVINSLVLPDGKIIVTGMRNSGVITNQVFVAKLSENGTLDTTFGTNGYYTGFQDSSAYYANIFLNSDKILIFYPQSSTIIKLNSDGTPDNTFGFNGKLELTPRNYSNNSVLIDNILYTTGEVNNQTYLFNIDIRQQTPSINSLFINGINNSNDLYLGLNQKLIIKSTDTINFTHFLTQINLNGPVIDTTFGLNGKLELHNMNSIDEIENSYDFITIDNFGNIIYGLSNDNTLNTIVKKFSSNGLLDTSFAENGIFTLQNSLLSCISNYSNKIYLGGAFFNNNSFDPLICRLNSNGTLDSTFDLDGKYNYTGNIASDWVESMNILSDNSILIAGEFDGNDNSIYLGKFITSNSLSTQEFNNQNSIVFTNPIESNLIYNSIQNVTSIDLYSVDGKLVRKIKENNESLLDLKRGIYFAKVKFSTGETKSIKLLKN